MWRKLALTVGLFLQVWLVHPSAIIDDDKVAVPKRPAPIDVQAIKDAPSYQSCPDRDGNNLCPCNCFGQICLGGGGKSATYAYGNVFVFGQPICDDGWTNTDAIVVCRQIGFSFGRYTSSSYYGTVQDRYIGDDFMCLGTEDHIMNCPHNAIDDCSSGEGAGVYCSTTG